MVTFNILSQDLRALTNSCKLTDKLLVPSQSHIQIAIF